MSLLDARSRFFDRSAAPARRGFGKLLQERDELRQREGPSNRRLPVDHSGAHVDLLEPKHEIGSGELDVGELPCAVIRKVEPGRRGELDRLRQGRHRAQVEQPERVGPNLKSGALEQGRCERAPKAVPGADESDVEEVDAGDRWKVPAATVSDWFEPLL